MKKVITLLLITVIASCKVLLLRRNREDPFIQLFGPGGFLNDTFIEIIRVTDEYYMYKIFDSVDDLKGELVDFGKLYFK